jgi:four helix bundle protein
MGRQYKKDTIQFLYIARGSIYELETLLKIAVMVTIIDEKTFENFVPVIDNTANLLSGLINYISKAELK